MQRAHIGSAKCLTTPPSEAGWQHQHQERRAVDRHCEPQFELPHAYVAHRESLAPLISDAPRVALRDQRSFQQDPILPAPRDRPPWHQQVADCSKRRVFHQRRPDHLRLRSRCERCRIRVVLRAPNGFGQSQPLQAIPESHRQAHLLQPRRRCQAQISGLRRGELLRPRYDRRHLRCCRHAHLQFRCCSQRWMVR